MSDRDQTAQYTQVRDASIRGAGFGVVAFVSKTLIHLASIAVLARLLTPADFGLVAMAGISLSLFHIIGDWGLLMAATQRRHMSEDQLSTLFWINVAGGVLLALLAIASAPVFVLVFGEPRLINAMVALSITLVTIGIGAQHEAIMRRRLRYGFLHLLGVTSQAMGFVAGIVAAVGGMGFWSLILQQVVARVARTALLWSGTRWTPGKPRRGVDLVEFLRYGAKLVPAHLLAYFSRGFAEIIVGVTTGVSELGIYRRAYGVVMMLEEIKQPLKAMMPASLSRLQDRAQDFSRFYVHALTMWNMVACGVIGLAAAEAPVIVKLLLGEQWLSAAPLIRWLAPAGLATAVGAATEWMLLPLGHMKRLLALRVLRACSVVVAVLIGWRWGVPGIAAALSLSLCLSLVIELIYTTIGKKLPVKRLVGAFVRPMISATTAGSLVFLVSTNGSFVMFFLESSLYVVLYIAVHAALPGGWKVIRLSLQAVRSVAGLNDRHE